MASDAIQRRCSESYNGSETILTDADAMQGIILFDGFKIHEFAQARYPHFKLNQACFANTQKRTQNDNSPLQSSQGIKIMEKKSQRLKETRKFFTNLGYVYK